MTKVNSELDAEVLAGIAPGCWVLDDDEDAAWWIVLSLPQKHQCGGSDVHCWSFGASYSLPFCNITAVHEPTRTPSLATAYLIGQKDEVTREEAVEMCRNGWTLHDRYGIRYTVSDDVRCEPPLLAVCDVAAFIHECEAIGSPGGNVYRIKEKP